MIELRDAITLAAVMVSLVSMILVSRNSRRATAVNAQSTDLARIRDLRAELREVKDELDAVRTQALKLNRQLIDANDVARAAYQERAEMLRYARMPGVSIDDWIARFDSPAAGQITG